MSRLIDHIEPSPAPLPSETTTLIENRTGAPIHGTFRGLSEGDEITAGGRTSRITYRGGGGNDVALIVPRSGDFNGNGLVEQADLDLVLRFWGTTVDDPIGVGWVNDFPAGLVDQEELDLVLTRWGEGSGSLPAVVPAPLFELPHESEGASDLKDAALAGWIDDNDAATAFRIRNGDALPALSPYRSNDFIV